MENPTCITIDIKEIESNKLADTIIVEEFIKQACRKFNLKPIGIPSIYKFKGGGGGITASQILGASLFSLHTYPEHNIIYIDVFSCKAFDYVGLFNFSKEYWGSLFGYLQTVRRLKKDNLGSPF